MRYEVENNVGYRIAPIVPTHIKSMITVPGQIMGLVTDVSVTINLMHSRTGDLKIFLWSPNGTRVELVGNEGGNGNHFVDTTFSEKSTSLIRRALPPFTGIFQPEGSLKTLVGEIPNGDWSLEVIDSRWFGGGHLNDWKLVLETDSDVSEQIFPGNKAIVLDFQPGISEEIKSLFHAVSAQWEQVINQRWLMVLPEEGIPVLQISVGIKPLDKVGGILGQAGPTRLGYDRLPDRGMMEFDLWDVSEMQKNGSLFSVIKHEMAHVLGFGTLWKFAGLLMGAGTPNPTYGGQKAIEEYSKLVGSGDMRPIPVANTGGGGTREAHWRESVFQNELMSGFLNAGNNPMSRMTIASLEDLGYKVQYNVADKYSLPFINAAAISGALGSGSIEYLPATHNILGDDDENGK